MPMDKIITTKHLVSKHGYHPRTAQRRIDEIKKKLGKGKDCDLFTSEFLKANKIKVIYNPNEIPHGITNIEEKTKELEFLKEKSCNRAESLGLVVGMTYEITYILMGHYEKTLIIEFRSYTEQFITAIFSLPESLQHEREISMAVEIRNGQIEPISSSIGSKVDGEYCVFRAVTLCTTIGIPTCSIISAKLI